MIEFATSLEKEDMWAVIGGFLALLGVTLLVFVYHFFVLEKDFHHFGKSDISGAKTYDEPKRNTFGIKNISNINLEQNLFQMIMGTYKIKD